MASSGKFNTTAYDGRYMTFSWSVASQSIENNTTTISWQLVGGGSGSGYYHARNIKVTIAGEVVYYQGAGSSTNYIKMYVGTVLASGTYTFTHNDDGTRGFTAYAEGGIYSWPVNCKGSGTYELDTIPRASAISCTTANIESNPTITIARHSPVFTHTVIYKFGTLKDTIAEKTTATSITNWTIPESFYSQIPDAKEGWGELYCTTYNGNTEIGTTRCDLIATTDETKCKPTVSVTVVDDNPLTIALTGNKNALIRYGSTAKCTMTATLNKGAGSFVAKTINNVAVSDNTHSFENVETNVFDFYAKDSRGWANSDKEVVATFIPYIKLTADATVYRNDPTSGDATLEIEGNYYKGSFGAKENSLTVEYIDGGKTYIVTPTIKDNKYSVKVALTGYDYRESFEIEVVVYDKVSYISKTLTLLKGIPVFDWGENDFNFNVPVTINGVNILEKLAYLEELATPKG